MRDRFNKQVNNLENEVLTARMVADYLNCHLSTLYRLVKDNRIPHFKLGGDFRFQKTAIAKWMKSGGGKPDQH